VRQSNPSAISNSRRQLRTCARRSCSSGDDQLNTGTRLSTDTPVSPHALRTSATASSSALG
jgi:hypothetical protein